MKSQSFSNSAARSVGLQLPVFVFAGLMCGVGGLLLHAAEPPTYYVNIANPTPTAPYTSWATAATNIQEAIEAGTGTDRLVLVTNGVYQTGSVDAGYGLSRIALWDGSTVVVRSVNGPEVTIIEGGRRNPETGEGEDARCAYVGTGSVLSGFTLRNGHASSGGGAYCFLGDEWTPGGVLTNCVLTGNSAGGSGGGACGGELKNCVLTDNSAAWGGGTSGSILENCTVTGNSATGGSRCAGMGCWWVAGRGGGAYGGTVSNCVVTANSANTGGGACDSEVSNSVLTGNNAEFGGGACGGSFVNCTVTGNSARGFGGGIIGAGTWGCFMGCWWSWQGDAQIRNSVVFFNTAPASPNWLRCVIESSCTTPSPPGTGNLDADPRLASVSHLSTNSPCIGAGNAATATGVDIDGEAWGSPPAMGADQPTPGAATGPLTVHIEADYSEVAVGFSLPLVGRIEGAALASEWDFGDGVVAKNQPWTRHAWTGPGVYSVRLTAFNDTAPQGISTTVEVRVTERTDYYVNVANPTPAFPYTSWETAATNIQQAIAAGTLAGRWVWVTNGVYGTGAAETNGFNRVALFDPVVVQSVNGPAETSIVGEDYCCDPETGNEQWIRCAFVGAEAVLSGFTLTNGFTSSQGAGAWCAASGVLTNCVVTGSNGDGVCGGTLYDCRLTNNWGRGVYGATLHRCTLMANYASQEGGGGAFRSSLFDCVLIGNTTDGSGGGALESTLRNCTLTGNTAQGSGGGAAASVLSNCNLNGNTAGEGGAVFESTLRNCTLTGNSADEGGGAHGGTLYNCVLTDNLAYAGGGAYGGTLYNCVVTGNAASTSGGADGSTLYNCTLTHNKAREFCGGAIGCTFYNCVVYFNTATRDANHAQCTLEYSCTTPLPPGPGNIDADPLLASASHLSTDSPCIGAGSAAYATGTDIDGEPWAKPPCIGADQPKPGQVTGPLAVRIEAGFTNVAVGFPVDFTARISGRCLMSRWDFGDGTGSTNQPWIAHAWSTPGLYAVCLTAFNDSEPEGVSDTLTVRVTEGVHYVNVANLSPVFPYMSWETAATNIQDAIAVEPGGLVLVTNGVYRTGGVQTNGFNRVVLLNRVTVQSVNGPEVTVIEGTNDTRCAYLTADTVLSGFTLTRGGGGAWCEPSGVLTNCLLTANSGTGVTGGTLYRCTLSGNSGGGASGGTLYQCTLTGNPGGGASGGTLYDCLLSNNDRAGGSGGGAASSTLYRCRLTGNSAREGGGAYGGTLHNCTLVGNVAGEGSGGGAVGATLYNCVVSDNSSGNIGGVRESTLYNCTVTGNSAEKPNGIGGASQGRLYNCIVYNNTARGVPSNYDSFGYTGFEYSCTTPRPPGPGNIDADPRLASISHLSLSSPCVGAGSAKYATGTDIDGDPWANPPCMGADQVMPGQAIGPLVMRIEASHTDVAPGFPARFVAWSEGPLQASVWDFGDGTTVTNQALMEHAWTIPGAYTIRLTGYSESESAGITTTIQVRVTGETHYVDAANPNPAFPYTSWATAATSIQQAVDASSLPGRLVLVTNGVYRTGSVSTNGLNRVALLNPVVVRSANGPGQTVIEGAAATRCAYVSSAAVLSGFTLTGGQTRPEGNGVSTEPSSGAGAWCEPAGVLTNCVVTRNGAYGSGGGVCGGTLFNCTLTRNSARYGGGANGSTLYDCVVSTNTAPDGGGVNRSTLFRCRLSGNSGSSGGGANSSTLRNCVLDGNEAQLDGGGAQNSTLDNCTVMGNSARRGGGISSGTLSNCTVTGNTASDEAGGVIVGTFYNCIVYFNTAREVADNYRFPGQTTFAYSCTWPLPAGPGNIDADPRLASATHLAPDSPCLAAGSAAYATGTDIDGEPWASPPCMGADQFVAGQATGPLAVRILSTLANFGPGLPVSFAAEIEGQLIASVWDFGDGTVVTNKPYARHAWSAPGFYTVRLAAYNDTEPFGVSTTTTVRVTETIRYVDVTNPTPAFPYASWATAATNIQQAIEASTFPGRTVLVSNGVYRTGATSANGLNRIALTDRVFVRSVHGPTTTVIEGTEGVRCAYVGVDAVLEGFTLRDGRLPTDWSGGIRDSGGGAWCEASGTLTNCVLAGNAAQRGGGVWGGRLARCVLTGNAAVSLGGGASDSTLSDCTLSGNSVSWQGVLGDGGGAANSSLYRCTIAANTSARIGGGAYNSTLQNCVIIGNAAFGGGGASGEPPDRCTLYNCTVTGNRAESFGGVSGSLHNCVVCFNTAHGRPSNYNYGYTSFEFSCTTPLPPGLGNIDADPRFVNAVAGDFRLRPDSPCIDAGTNLVELITTDLDGHPRPLDGNGDGAARFDMGAYEYDPAVLLRLTVALTPTGPRLEWPATAIGATLQRTATLTNPDWQDVAGSETATTLTLPPANVAEFFRLMKP